MSTHHFLASASAKPPVQPTDRWLAAFPTGRWHDWNTLRAALQPGDTVWLPTAHADWLERLAQLLKEPAHPRVVVLSSTPEDREGLLAVDRGARGYCHTHAVPALFQDVAQVVAQGGMWLGADLMDRIVAAARDLLARSSSAPPVEPDLSLLSAREAEVARAVVAGKSNREVADQLFISERTVKAHLGAVFEKLGVRDRLQLALHLSGRQPAAEKARP